MSSATDKQRRLLDELRKLACDINENEIRSHSVITLNQGRYNRQFRLDMNHDWLNAWHAELERILQAIEATLGPETCQADETDTWECVCDGIGHYGERMTIHVMECDKCGHTYEHVNGSYEYCPHCGRRIVEVDDG